MARSDNPNPVAAQQAKRAKRKDLGDVEALRSVLWDFIKRLEQHITASPVIDPETLKPGRARIRVGRATAIAIVLNQGETEGKPPWGRSGPPPR